MSLDITLIDEEGAFVSAVRGDEYESKVYEKNITHNLALMADQAGVYQAMWRPEERGWTKAGELIWTLERGLAELKDKPQHYDQYAPANGWGTYYTLVNAVESYLEACRKYPHATINTCR